MKYLVLLFLTVTLQANAAKPVDDIDKIFLVPPLSDTKDQATNFPKLPLVEKLNQQQRPNVFYYLGLIQGDMKYNLPATNGGTTDLDSANFGINAGKKIYQNKDLYQGYLEISLEWQRYQREAGYFDQKINIYLLNLIQNIDLIKMKDLAFISMGLGITPVYLTAERSVFGDSISRLGAILVFKTDFMLKVYHHHEVDLAFKIGWGKVASEELIMPSLHLGINFE